jgi:hypothetical protein
MRESCQLAAGSLKKLKALEDKVKELTASVQKHLRAWLTNTPEQLLDVQKYYRSRNPNWEQALGLKKRACQTSRAKKRKLPEAVVIRSFAVRSHVPRNEHD